jgi:hypothetical protein
MFFGQRQIERQHVAILQLNLQRDLVAVNLAGLDVELVLFVRTGGSGDLVTVLLEIQESSVRFGFAIRSGDIEASGPFAADVGQQADHRKQKTTHSSFHAYGYAPRSSGVPLFANAAAPSLPK